VVGRPFAFNKEPDMVFGSWKLSKYFTFILFTKLSILSNEVLSTATIITWNSSSPISLCSLSSEGISTRHGKHQVAQKLTNKIFPEKSENMNSLFSLLIKVISANLEPSVGEEKITLDFS
ncbi:uncharacterized protein METZ01_LOCUS61804, partial [marine metagenome]